LESDLGNAHLAQQLPLPRQDDHRRQVAPGVDPQGDLDNSKVRLSFCLKDRQAGSCASVVILFPEDRWVRTETRDGQAVTDGRPTLDFDSSVLSGGDKIQISISVSSWSCFFATRGSRFAAS